MGVDSRSSNEWIYNNLVIRMKDTNMRSMYTFLVLDEYRIEYF